VPKVTQEHLDARRAQILEGARSAFARYGYHGATFTRLEEATGLSRGSIFRYFDDKKDLFLAVGTDVNRRYIDAITAGGFAEAIHELARDNPELLAVLLEAEMRLYRDEDFRRRMEESTADDRARLEAWFQEQRASGEVRTDLNWRDLARFASIVLNGTGLRIARGDETDMETVTRLLGDALHPQSPRHAPADSHARTRPRKSATTPA
jgi:AcrR family transcriptional regulator